MLSGFARPGLPLWPKSGAILGDSGLGNEIGLPGSWASVDAKRASVEPSRPKNEVSIFHQQRLPRQAPNVRLDDHLERSALDRRLKPFMVSPIDPSSEQASCEAQSSRRCHEATSGACR